MSVPTFTAAGAKATTAAKLPKEVFGLESVSHDLIKQAYLAYLANGRLNLAVTKTRGEVRGGGRKPWRQKGTGRARFGSTRNPIWTGGGIAFGPTGQENYRREMTVSARRQALKSALSLKAGTDISVIEDLTVKSGKTADAVKLLNKLGSRGNILIVSVKLDDKTKQALSNLPRVSFATAASLSTYAVMNADSLIITEPAIKALSARLGGKS